MKTSMVLAVYAAMLLLGQGRGQLPDLDIPTLLSDGDKLINLDGENRVIVIMGLTGTGKSTLLKFVLHDESLVVEKKKGTFLFSDKGATISNQTLVSKTLIPNIRRDLDTGIVLVDCPGFSDTRSAQSEIASTYFIKKVLESAKEIKIILVENHSSLIEGNDRNGFTNLLEHVAKLIPDIEYLRGSLGFVASKCDRNNPDEEEIEFILQFFNETKHFINEKLQGKFNHSQQEINRWKKMANVLNILLGDFSGNNIALFRRPVQVGYPWTSDVILSNYESLRKLVFTSTHFAKNEKGIFKYAVSQRSLLLIKEEWLEKYKENVAKNFQSFTSVFEVSFLKRLDQIPRLNSKLNFIHQLKGMVNIFHNNFNFLHDLTDIYHQLLREINTQIFNHKFKNNIINAIKQTEFLYSVADESIDQVILEIKKIFSTQIVQVVKNYCCLYEYLILVEKGLLQYEIQSKRAIYYRDLRTFMNKEYFRNLILGLDDLKIDSNLTIFVSLANVSKQYVSELHDLLTENLDYKVNQKQIGTKFCIEGHNLILSEVNSFLEGHEKYEEVNLLSYNYVYIDEDLFIEGAHLNIIAPYIYVTNQFQITLVGRKVEDYNKAPNSNLRTKPGDSGRAGIPGLNSGNIFVVSLEVFHQDRLTVMSIGGRGGKGEDGGDGTEGKASPIPNINTLNGTEYYLKEQINNLGYEHYFATAETIEDYMFITVVASYVTKYWAYIIGVINKQSNVLPTKGGDGGVGGIGGKPGNIIITTKYENNIKTHKRQGVQGMYGVGGKGGRGAPRCAIKQLYCKGYITMLFAFFVPTFLDTVYYYDCKTRNNEACSGWFCDKGNYCENDLDQNNGNTGVSLHLQLNQKTIIENINYKNVLNLYKTFALSIQESKYHQYIFPFLDFIQNEERFLKSYNPVDYINDVFLIESKLRLSVKNFEQLRFYFVNLYDSFVFARRYGYVKNTIESYLVEYVLLSKLETIRSLQENKFIVDLGGYIAQRLTVLDQIKSDGLIARLYESSEAYFNEFTKVIEENKFLLVDELEKRLKQKMEEADESIETISNEIFAIRQDRIRNSKDLLELEKSLGANMQKRAVFETLNVLKTVINVFSNIAGTAFSTIVDIAEENVVQEIDVTKKTAAPNLPRGIEFGIKILNDVNENSIAAMKSKARTYDNIIEKLKSLIETNFNNSDFTVVSLLGNITYVSNSLKNFDVANNNDTFKAIVNLEEIFSQSNNIVSIIEKEHISSETDSDVVSTIRAIKKFTTLTSQASRSVVSTLQKYAKDEHKLKKVHEALEKNGKMIRELNKFEKSLFQIIQPLFNNLTDTLKQFSNDLQGKTYFLLQFKKLDIKSHLKEILTFVSRFTQGFEGGEDLTQVVTDLEDLIFTVIDAYDKINELEYKHQLAKFITNVNSQDFRNTVINNANYSALFSKVRKLISSNILIAEYNSIYQAYKQHTFPFLSIVVDYLNFDTIDIGNETLIMDKTLMVMNGINEINKKLIETKTQIREDTDTIIHTAEFYSYSALNSFFKWNGREHSRTIRNFLRGDRITLLADVKKVQHLNAVKFTTLQLNITCREHLLNTNLHLQLKSLQVEMKHMGESHYKCDLKYFAISGNSFTITHSFETNQRGIPTSRNFVYDKIIAGDISLSPYTMWQFQLKPLPGYFMPDLSRYFGLIDLELVGTGQYISEGSEICATPLEMHYDTLK